VGEIGGGCCPCRANAAGAFRIPATAAPAPSLIRSRRPSPERLTFGAIFTFLRFVVMTRSHFLSDRGAGLTTFHASTRIILHNRQALKHWRRHAEVKPIQQDDTGRMVAEFLISGAVSRDYRKVAFRRCDIQTRELRTRRGGDSSPPRFSFLAWLKVQAGSASRGARAMIHEPRVAGRGSRVTVFHPCPPAVSFCCFSRCSRRTALRDRRILLPSIARTLTRT